MKILDRYIGNAIIFSTLIVSAVIVGIQSFLSLIAQVHFVGEQNYTMLKALLYVGMQIPAQIYQLFPIAGFLGALIGLGRLSSSSQLIVMRASGMSIMRIMWSVIKTALLMIIVVTAIGEGVGPVWQQQSAVMQQEALYPPHNNDLLNSIWLHQENSFTHIGELTDQGKMLDVTRYRFGPQGRLKKATAAESGELIHGQWTLSNLKETIFEHQQIEIKKENEEGLQLVFQPKLQVEMKTVSGEQTLTALYHTIRYRQSVGLGIDKYLFTFWQRLLQPITSLVLITLAVPFVFGSFRSATMGLRLLTGVLMGFAFYMLNQLFGPITLVYQFPPLFSAVIPTCLFLLIGIFLLFRTKQ
ncbi:MAG: LPS export ABC transporter permease LptG [Gammaproteobacteria bacterium]|nr:LPS export ABC transporter permease LptG [Gammaproteobacteria bacterium]